MIAALYVCPRGPYAQAPGLELWDEQRDARLFRGPWPVIAHPPCERWGRYWGGGPMLHGTPKQKLLGDDGGCFAHALWSVRTFGGVLEHPEASHAFHYYGLPVPLRTGGWTDPDRYGGRSCCVAQGHYGHRAQKLTWLYAVGTRYPELIWGPTTGKMRLDQGFTKKGRAKASNTKPHERITEDERIHTPKEFAELLTGMLSVQKRMAA
jgi:hypothetical protein